MRPWIKFLLICGVFEMEVVCFHFLGSVVNLAFPLCTDGTGVAYSRPGAENNLTIGGTLPVIAVQEGGGLVV